MSILLNSVGAPLTVGGQALQIGGTYTPPPVVSTGPIPSVNLAGWWDASALTPGGMITTITDSSTAGKTAGTYANAIPRVAGLLGGLYAEGSVSNFTVLHPVIDDYVVAVNNIAVGASQSLTVALVWSRPNQRQPNKGALSNLPVDLLAIGGVTVLRMTALGNGADTLTLFPTLSPINAGTLELRHTHSARLVFSGSTVDVWLDGTKIITASANQITLGSTANLSFLPNAQCIFHEAAAWNKTLDATEHTALTAYLSRWPLGPRRAANGVPIGQSNAALLFGNYVLWPQLNKAVSYLTGCISSNLLWGSGGTLSGNTMFSGQGLYDGTANLILDNSGGGDPSTWPLGANGNTYVATVNGMSADQKANLYYDAWHYSESDADRLTYAAKAIYLGAMKRALSLIRAGIGRTAAQFPVLVINALPFTTAEGCQTHREVMADLVADASLNVHFMLANAQDAIGQGDTWDSTTGQESGGGNTAHRDYTGASMFLRRWAAPIARAVIAAQAASGTPDAITAIDASIPVTGGPRITAAHHEGGTSVLVTFAHDGGNDLIVPLRAALGVGWTLMDGVSGTVAGTPGAPGTLIAATACARVSATQVRLTLASAPTNPGKAQLYYPYGTGLDASGYAVIGRGNAVTDNFSAVTLAAGWRIGQDLGASAQPNNPVQATTYGIALT